MIKSLLLRRVKSRGDDTLQQYYPEVYAYALRRVGVAEVAEEIAAEAIAAALVARSPRGEILPWLYGIAARKLADYLRKRDRRSERPLPESLCGTGPGPWEQAVENERMGQIRDLIDSLPQDQREAILLFYVEDLPARGVAVAMGKSESAINSLLQRARQDLRIRGRHLSEVESE